MEKKLHYSLFNCEDKDGDLVLIDLSKITYITANKDYVHFVTLSNNECVPLSGIDGDRLVEAWNLYKYAASAAQLVKIPDITNPTIACNSAMRLDEYLGFLAGEKLKEFAEFGC